MSKKKTIESIIRLLGEETRKIKKKKKKHPLVAMPILTRPMGSIFYMDAGVSMAESEMLNENSAIKPITKKFDHLKWILNDFQKQFLDDFINIPDASLKDKDFEYASNRTGIPVQSIKSIRNTYADKKTPEATTEEMQRIHKELVGGTLGQANSQFIGARDLPSDKIGKLFPMNPNPEFRNKSLGQMGYENNLASEVGGKMQKKYERELPGFMYEWLLYFIEGSEIFKITESKLMNDFNSTKFDKYKYVLFSFDVSIKESNSHAYDNVSSDSKLKELKEFREKIKEFNDVFNTNFIVGNQYTGNDGFLKVVIENAQTTDGKNVFNRKFINMEDNDIKKAISLGFYDIDSTTRSIT